MNILDENILEEQRLLLQKWRVSIHQIGHDVGRKGLKDKEIIPLLQQLRRSTFFTRDLDFYRRSLCHGRYCLVYMAVEKDEVARFVRRLLRHAEFNTEAKRMGAVIHISGRGISAWRPHAEKEVDSSWKD